ncbi:probable G- coupled receptor Mth-like 12 [Paramuricea clavata]|uniref:Probable G- coupled receptor Mth-like 12 n=1 Tax=Paramuricea clavata TaxID=317549 RepID=A0A6S7GK03_PARCT|nr:probable G- coupled receptor Mth-like 12 [Paramuricea clavata]
MVYNYTEYRVLDDGIKICNSTDNDARNTWKLRNDWVKATMHYKSCNKPIAPFRLYQKYYIVNKQFTVYFAARSQYFTRNSYGVRDGKPQVCNEKFKPTSSEYTQEDLLMCNDSMTNIKYDDEYTVRIDFSILYKNKVYDYTEYRVLNDGIKICNSTDKYVKNIWKLRNDWVKATMHQKSCNQPVDVHAISQEFYTVRMDFSVLILPTDQVIAKYDYGVFEGKLKICKEKLIMSYYVKLIGRIKPAGVAVLCALALSMICLLLLLIVYCMLPELRTLPGLNLMSLSFAVLLLLTYTAVYLSLYSRVGQVLKIPACDRIEITKRFILYSIITNAAANVYHLRKTFCGNTLVKSDVENKWKTFLKYSVFSWGVPLIITIVYIVLDKTDVLRFHHADSADCVSRLNNSDWLAVMEEYGLPGCLLLYIIVMFSFTAYRIRQKLKASSNIAQKSNIVKKRNSFVLLLK